MEYAVVLNIRSEIITKGEEPQKMDFMTPGKLFSKDGGWYIIYEETELSGLAGSKTMLKFKDGMCSMHRYGPHASQLTFEVGVKHESIYGTPYGNFNMTTKGRTIDTDFETGKVKLVYDLVIDGLSESVNTLEVDIVSRKEIPQEEK